MSEEEKKNFKKSPKDQKWFQIREKVVPKQKNSPIVIIVIQREESKTSIKQLKKKAKKEKCGIFRFTCLCMWVLLWVDVVLRVFLTVVIFVWAGNEFWSLLLEGLRNALRRWIFDSFFASLEKETVIKVATDRFGFPNGLTLPPVGVALAAEQIRGTSPPAH